MNQPSLFDESSSSPPVQGELELDLADRPRCLQCGQPGVLITLTTASGSVVGICASAAACARNQRGGND